MSGQATELLARTTQGDKTAVDQLMPLVYDRLREVARKYSQDERPGHTLQPTALINEAHLRLVDLNRMDWKGRTRFFAISG